MKEQEGLLFTDAEAERIVLMSVAAEPQTEEQMEKVWHWACDVRAGELILQCVLSGDVAPFVKEDGQIYFKKMRDIEQPRKETTQ